MSKIIVYDFDGTLTKSALPKYPIMKNKNLKLKIETILNYLLNYERGLYNSYFEMYFKVLNDMGLALSNETFCYGAEDVCFRKGVLDYFERTKEDDTKHFIVTCGYDNFVLETKIGKYIEKVFGTTYKFDGSNVVGIDCLMDNENKAVAINEIIKNYPGDITYVGDGLTDKVAFDCVKKNGGKCILIKRKKYASLSDEALLLSGVIDHYVDADFSKNSDLCKCIENKK